MRHALSLVQGDVFGSVTVPDPALKDWVAPADTAHTPKISSLIIIHSLPHKGAAQVLIAVPSRFSEMHALRPRQLGVSIFIVGQNCIARSGDVCPCKSDSVSSDRVIDTHSQAATIGV